MSKHTVKSMFEIGEMTELGKQVYQIVEDGNPEGKFVIVGVDKWEAIEEAVKDVSLQLEGTSRPPVKNIVTHGLSTAIEKLVKLLELKQEDKVSSGYFFGTVQARRKERK